MNAAEIIARKVQRSSSRTGFPTSYEKPFVNRVSLRIAGTDAEICTLNDADVHIRLRIRIANNGLRYCFHHLRWRILPLAFNVTLAVDFD